MWLNKAFGFELEEHQKRNNHTSIKSNYCIKLHDQIDLRPFIRILIFILLTIVDWVIKFFVNLYFKTSDTFLLIWAGLVITGSSTYYHVDFFILYKTMIINWTL